MCASVRHWHSYVRVHPRPHKQSKHLYLPWSTTWFNNYIPSRQTLSPYRLQSIETRTVTALARTGLKSKGEPCHCVYCVGKPHIYYLLPVHPGWESGQWPVLPISDTMTSASPPTTSPRHSGPTVTGPSTGSSILTGQGSRDEVMMSPRLLASDLESRGWPVSRGFSYTLGLLFSAHSQWATSGTQSSLWWL